MKWKLLLALSFCFSLLSPLTTTAGEPALRPPTGGYNSPAIKNPTPPKTGNVGTGLNPANDPIYENGKKFSKTKKIVKVGGALKVANHIRKNKWKYAAGAAVVGGTAGYVARKYKDSEIVRNAEREYYQNDIDRIIDREFYSDKFRSEKKAKLVPILYKKIHNSKPEKQELVIEAIQQALIPYMVFYEGEPFDKLADSILVSLNIMTNNVVMQTAFEREKQKEAHQLIVTKMDNVIKSRKKTNCQKGSFEREYITTNIIHDTTSKSLSEWDVDHYGSQIKANNRYLYNVRKNNGKPTDFDKDHIPSKLAVTTYLSNRDNFGVKYDASKIKIIHENAITVVMKRSIHKLGRTHNNKNKVLGLTDSTNLKKAIYDDFAFYYVLAYKDGYNDVTYKLNWITALIQTYIENEKLCLLI